MVNTSKVLTVSYGTFSCTLEGFDDSFGTMKAIAEYFRDLAADDRYFGAEPPTPDAEMLARIAERDIARRVEAHREDGGIVLRAQDPAKQAAIEDAIKDNQAVEAARAALVAPVHAPVNPGENSKDAAPDATPDTAELAAEAEAEAAQGQAQAAALAALEPATSDHPTSIGSDAFDPDAEPLSGHVDDGLDGDDTVAARLDGIRSVVNRWNESFDDEYSEDEHAMDLVRASRVKEAEDDALEDDLAAAMADVPDAPDAPEAAPESITDVAAKPEAAAIEPAETKAPASDDDMLAHLADQLADDAATDQAAPVADAVEDVVQEAAEQVAETTIETDVAPDDDDPEYDDPEEGEPEEDDGLEDTLAQLLADSMPEDSLPKDAETGAIPAAAAPEAEKPAPFLLGAEMQVNDTPAATEEPTDAVLGADMPRTATVQEGETAQYEEVEDVPSANRPLRARVVKMKRSDFEAAVAGGALVEEEDETLGADPEAGVLTPEEEDELQRELAAVSAELAASDAPEATDEPEEAPDQALEEAIANSQMAELQADAEVDQPQAPSAHDVAPEADEPTRSARLQDAEQDSDVSRLFNKADSQFEEPESSQRRNAIQHLRAAVAATRAEKKDGTLPTPEDEKSEYQADIDEVVRPRRPSARADRGQPEASARPPKEQPASPLRLVAEQRVAEADAASADVPDPVMPRRVSTSSVAAETPAESGFTAFAEALGTKSLTDLLEAAAAYMAEVEGQDQFSRPMLMGKIKEATQKSGPAFSREDGLRSFGQLLRDGKLKKLKGGRFAVTEATEFRDDAREAG